MTDATPNSPPAPRGAGHRTGFGVVTVGSLASGAAAYGVIALGTRAVGEAAFAPVSVLWSLWALSAAAITFPVQHWVIRSAEVAGEGAVWALGRRLRHGAVLASILVAVLSLATGSRLYTASWSSFATMTVVLPLGSLAVGFQRGILAHRRQFGDVAFSMAAENGLRAVVAATVLLLGPDPTVGARAIGWGIVAGFAVAGTRPSAFRRRGGPQTRRGASVRLLGGFAGANVAAQAALTFGPVVLAILAARDEVITEVFTVLALLRVPYTGVVGASAAITGPLTRLVTAPNGPARVRRAEAIGSVAAVVAAALAWPLAPLVLPPLVRLLFGTTLTISGTAQGALAAGGVLALAGLFQMLVQVARDRPRRLVASWALGLAVGIVVLALPVSPVLRVSTAFLAAEATALAGLVLRRPRAKVRSDA